MASSAGKLTGLSSAFLRVVPLNTLLVNLPYLGNKEPPRCPFYGGIINPEAGLAIGLATGF